MNIMFYNNNNNNKEKEHREKEWGTWSEDQLVCYQERERTLEVETLPRELFSKINDPPEVFRFK